MTFHVKHFLFLFILFPIALYSQNMGTTTLEIKPNPTMPSRDVEIDRFLDRFEETKLLNNGQKEWFYWTNYSRKNPKKFWDSVISPFLNSFPNLNSRNSNSLKAELYRQLSLSMLKPNVDLLRMSQEHASASASKKVGPSHTSPNGFTFQDRVTKAGIKYCAGENISFGRWNPTLSLVLLYIDEGVSELGHRKSLLDPTFVEMGIGIGIYPNDQFFIVQDFACSQFEGNVSRETNH